MNSKYPFKAVIFDLDGVITKTALVHSAAWKKMFDEYLRKREQEHNEPFKEFTHAGDYLPHVDGKPRYKGVQDFLESRGISIPYGDPGDPADAETICGLGNRKNQAFNEVLDEQGVETYESTLTLMKKLKEKGIRIGVASSSKNCERVLQVAGLLDMIETRVDGVVSAELGLKGKPEPDIFTTAADNLGVPYDLAVVVEDAVSGVEAGRKGNFGFVLGIAREENEKELYRAGADIVVDDIDRIGFKGLVEWFRQGLEADSWSVTYRDYAPSKEKSRESLLAVGNGYFGTRGAMEEIGAGDHNYPGTYMSGVYNRLISKVGDRDIENEDLVNCPNWLPVKFRINGEEWLDANNSEVMDIYRNLDFRTGLLYKHMILKDSKGNLTRIDSRRVASMDDPHAAAIRYSITPLNYAGSITLQSGIDGDLINAGVERYKQLNQNHLSTGNEGESGEKIYVTVRTVQSGITLCTAARNKVFLNGALLEPKETLLLSTGRAFREYEVDVPQDGRLDLEKLVSIYRSGKDGVNDPEPDALKHLNSLSSFDEIYEESALAWNKVWQQADIQVTGDRLAQKLLRMHIYHLMVTTSLHNKNIDAGIPARGLHGEAYRGHIFWDELYILPFYYMHFPKVARSILEYRYRRLDKAREYAKEYGYRGAMFPWQSGSDGREETQIIHLNPLTGEWGPDFSSLQRHVSLAIAYNTWMYYHYSGDMPFMKKEGAELFFEICRFWASKAVKNNKTGRYSIEEVMGPDEFHEKYKDSEKGGLKDNAYTNLMVVWCLEKALDYWASLDDKAKKKLSRSIGLDHKELVTWKDITEKLALNISKEGIIAQFDGYFDLEELDWDYYRTKYGNIYRMDRILKAEGKSADDYKLAKQADTLMTFYNLDKEDVDRILEDLKYELPEDYLQKNLHYYLQRTSHGSTLSRVVHAYLASLVGDKALSWELYNDALQSDYVDIQGGTTGEGIHAGVMAGTLLIALNTFAGLNLKHEVPVFNPDLPDHWRSIAFNFHFRENYYECRIFKDHLEIRASNPGKIIVKDKVTKLSSNKFKKINFIK